MVKMRRSTSIITRFVARRSNTLRLFLFLVLCTPLMCCWIMVDVATTAFLPTVSEQDLRHLQRNRNLKNYLDNFQLLVEPTSAPCEELLVLVTSSPSRFQAREAIRNTWGRHLATLFVLGVDGYMENDLMVDNYLEAKMHGDIIIYQFKDHYQNLTLKTGLMLQWTLARCPTASFLFKTDDDVLVNPWKMKRIVEEKSNESLIGYVKRNSHLHRDGQNKWYVPRWLLRDDFVPQYLSGTGYLINVKCIKPILEAAYTVPIINLEDVYFTYLVANKTLDLKLTHDRYLSPYKPWLPLGCLYWGLASAHSLTPDEITKWGSYLIKMGADYANNKNICVSAENYGEWLLY